ncbi:GntR family transcriptional regulator [Kordiimonas sp. SCSIO 12610]|uniref:GntR family transcriptional regulator n=1 Tax=Kordiimonas sp. SCSIO 12610 TaxID=2829597 RepID=UPI00210967A6|nr:GntR family transcriptional regulator [Kordiimonas sp. SCSIO 12610]UTW54674.1 GntR family transcriptional regulator [Kordiimonas sp. SCSIO 12610]
MSDATIKIQIVTGDSRPIFKQIVDGIRMEISTGNLAVGSKLPSYRGLAMQLMINPNTVAKAYSELSSQGMVESRKGLGLFVAEPRQILSADEKENRLEKAIGSFVNETVYLQFTKEEIIGRLTERLDLLNDSKKDRK